MRERDLRDRLRRAPVPNASDAEQRTVSAAVARAEQRSASGREAGTAPRRTPRIRRIALLAGTGAIVLLVATAILRGAGEPTEADSFSSFAALAAEQDRDGVHHVQVDGTRVQPRSPFSQHPFAETTTIRDEIWSGPERGFVRRLSGREGGFLTERDREIWVEEGRPNTPIQRAPGIADDRANREYLLDRDAGIACWAPPIYDPEVPSAGEDGTPEPILCREPESLVGTGLDPQPNLPTDPNNLRETLLRQLGSAREIDAEARRGPGLRAVPPGAGPSERERELEERWGALQLPSAVARWWGLEKVSEADWIFAIASEHLKNPLTEPQLRSALFEVLGGVEGLTLTLDREDRIGRDAVLVEYAGSPPLVELEEASARILPIGAPGGERRFEIYLDPETSQVLELRRFVSEEDVVRLAAPPPGVEIDEPDYEDQGADGDQLVAFELFRHGSADSLPPSADRFEVAVERELVERERPEQPATCDPSGGGPPGEPQDSGLQELEADEHGQPARVTLTAGPNWRLIVTEGRALQARTHKDGTMINSVGSSAWTRPITLNEAGSYLLRRDGEPATVVAGPVTGEAVEVVVETMDGERVPASLADAYGLRWFWAEIGGTAWATAITACGADGEVVDVYDSPADYPLIPHPMSFEIR